MISKIDICNRALQLLGAESISALTENNKSARALTLAYDSCRKSVLRSHAWNFAIKRAELAADATPPDWGKANRFRLPEDFFRLLNTDPEKNFNTIDYQIEQNFIHTNYPAPLQIRYIFDCTNTDLFDPMFAEVLSAKIAYEICDQISQSNTDRQELKDHLKEQVMEARRINAFENIAAAPPEDTYLTVRI